MGWFDALLAALQAASQPAAATAPSSSPTSAAPAMVAAAAAAPVAGTPVAGPGMFGSDEQRRILWSPDHSSFIDMNQHPNALWRDATEGGGSEGAQGTPAGWYTGGGYDSSGSEGFYAPPQLVSPFEDVANFGGDMSGRTTAKYQDLKDAGLWNLQDPNSDAWQYLQGMSNYPGVRYTGDPMHNVGDFANALNRASVGSDGFLGRTSEGRANYEADLRAALSDFDPEFVNLLVPAMGDQLEGRWTADKQSEGQGFWKDAGDVGSTFADMFTQTPLGAALMAYLGPSVAAGFGGGTAGTVAAGATLGGANASLAGGDILKGAVQGGLSSYGGSQIPGGEAVAGAGATAGGADFSGAVPTSSTPGFTTISPEGVPMSSTPAMTNFSATEGGLPVFTGQTGAFATPGMLNGFNSPMSDSDLDKLDLQNRDALEAGDNPPAPTEAPAKAPLDPRTAAKVLNAIIGMTGNDSAATRDAPQRQEGQTDADYSQNLAQYLSLDADAMAQQGLVPGTQEYYDYVMQQADQVIQQIAGDVDVNADDLTAQFRGKSEQELEQLQRALYVRGQLGTLAGSGQHTDPFTGASQNVVSPDGMLFNPSVGAFQRGKAGDVENLRGLRGQEGFDQLQQLLGRKSDLFGMDRAAQERFEQAKLEDDLRRRRGMLSYS